MADRDSEDQSGPAAAPEVVRRFEVLSSALHEFVDAGLDYERLLHVVAQRVVDAADVSCVILLTNGNGAQLDLVAVESPYPELAPVLTELLAENPARVETSASRAVVVSGQPLVVNDLPPSAIRDMVAEEHRIVFDRFPVYNMMISPLPARGRVIGVVATLRHRPGRPFTPEDVALVSDIAERAALAIDSARLFHALGETNAQLEQRVAERTSELRAAMAVADEANRAKSRFLSRMSHELRTPLNSILGFGQLLDLEPLDERADEFVDHILHAGRHLLDLVDEVLDIARIESGELHLTIEPVRVEEVVDAALALIEPTAEQCQVRLEHDRARTSSALVAADRQRLLQVMLNLVSNAVKYNQQGGKVSVGIGRGDPGRVRIEVADNGIGIDADHLGRIYEPFERLGAEMTGVEGTGMGLAVTKALVEHMGGTIGADSVRGLGTTFVVDLDPASDGSAADAEDGSRTGPARSDLADALVVLCVEDNVANVRLIERVAELREGIVLHSSLTGQGGIALAKEVRPDLVLLDLHLPDLGGAEVLAALRADPATCDASIAIVSADATPAHIEQMLAEGADCYLTKPVDISALLDLFDSLSQAKSSGPGD